MAGLLRGITQQAGGRHATAASAARSRWLCVAFVLALAFAVALQSTSFAQQDDAPSLADLRKHLAQLDEQLAAARASADALAKLQASQRQSLEAQRAELASQLLDADLRRHSLLDEKAKLAQERDELAADHAAVAPAMRDAWSAARRGGEQLQIHLGELPGQDEALASLATQLQSLDAADPAQAATALATLLELANASLADAATIRTRTTELWTAREEREAVELLSVGHVAFAYRTVADSRLGLAYSSPDQASGYRWSETMPAATQTQLREAFDALSNAGAGASTSASTSTDPLRTLHLPIDVSGRLQPNTLVGQASLTDRFREGGLVMLPLALVALMALLLIVERVWVLYGRNYNAGSVANRVIAACQRSDFDEAIRLCESRPGAVVHTLAACLRRRTKGQAAMEDSVQAQLLSELPRLQRFMGGIAILAAVAPLLGLLGTVTGIIQTFGVIRAFGNANPSLMAGGISEALITTAAGLIIAVPILLIHGLLSGRVDRIVGNAEKHAANLLAVLAHDVPRDAAATNIASPESASKPAATNSVEGPRHG